MLALPSLWAVSEAVPDDCSRYPEPLCNPLFESQDMAVWLGDSAAASDQRVGSECQGPPVADHLLSTHSASNPSCTGFEAGDRSSPMRDLSSRMDLIHNTGSDSLGGRISPSRCNVDILLERMQALAQARRALVTQLQVMQQMFCGVLHAVHADMDSNVAAEYGPIDGHSPER